MVGSATTSPSGCAVANGTSVHVAPPSTERRRTRRCALTSTPGWPGTPAMAPGRPAAATQVNAASMLGALQSCSPSEGTIQIAPPAMASSDPSTAWPSTVAGPRRHVLPPSTVSYSATLSFSSVTATATACSGCAASAASERTARPATVPLAVQPWGGPRPQRRRGRRAAPRAPAASTAIDALATSVLRADRRGSLGRRGGEDVRAAPAPTRRGARGSGPGAPAWARPARRARRPPRRPSPGPRRPRSRGPPASPRPPPAPPPPAPAPAGVRARPP